MHMENDNAKRVIAVHCRDVTALGMGDNAAA
jgi:hypothetical protein